MIIISIFYKKPASFRKNISIYQVKQKIEISLKIHCGNLLRIFHRIKKIGANLPVIMITGHGDMSKAMEAIKLGAVDYIAKPFSNEYIINLIKSVL